MTDAPTTGPETATPPPARVRRPRFSVVWLVPIIAAIIAGYLGYRTVMERGPLLTITFDTGEGLAAGQTQIRYKSVALGTVESIDLARDNDHVIVRIRMNSVGARFLTDHARFWVVRPTFAPGNFSGLETLVSGDYIAVDPGLPGGHYRTSFVGLEEPPGVRSDEPGHTYILKAANIGSLGSGSPVFYRDVAVGEVLGYDIGDGLGPVTVSIFVRSPYDRLVRAQSHFWNSSGISADIQNGNFHIVFQSLQAVISGGVTFDLPPEAANSAPSPNNAVFPLYPSQDAADAAGYQRKIPLVSYFDSSVSGLTRGAPVIVLGIQVGEVTDVRLLVDLHTETVKVRVAMDLQPERIFKKSILPAGMTLQQGLQELVDKGLRAELATANYVTGQEVIALTPVPNAPQATITREGDAFVMPSQPGALDTAMDSLSALSARIAKIPFEDIGNNLDKLLVTANGTIGSTQIKKALTSFSETLNTASVTLGTINQSFGLDSEFQRNLEQLMDQANSTLRSIDLLTSYLDRHPEALLRGRSGQ